MKSHSRAWLGYVSAICLVALCTAIGRLMTPRFDIVNIAMVYLLAVVVIALFFSRGAAILSAVLSVGTFDVMFVPPPGTFNVHDVQYVLTFGILLVVALVISTLMERSRRQAEKHASLMIDAATESNRTILLASISHDLRTPLAVLCGASSSLLESGERMSPAERVALTGSIYSQALSMSDQVNKILQMTRIESQAMAVEADWVDMGELASSAVQRIADRLRQHHVLVQIPDDLPLIWLDAALIEQVLVNLLENTAKHTPPGAIVQLRAEVQDHEMVISVIDSGPGIDENRLEEIFAKFQHGATPNAASGVGLGLAICRAIIVLHKGRIWAENVIDGGCAFHFSVPLGKAPAAPIELEAP